MSFLWAFCYFKLKAFIFNSAKISAKTFKLKQRFIPLLNEGFSMKLFEKLRDFYIQKKGRFPSFTKSSPKQSIDNRNIYIFCPFLVINVLRIFHLSSNLPIIVFNFSFRNIQLFIHLELWWSILNRLDELFWKYRRHKIGPLNISFLCIYIRFGMTSKSILAESAEMIFPSFSSSRSAWGDEFIIYLLGFLPRFFTASLMKYMDICINQSAQALRHIHQCLNEIDDVLSTCDSLPLSLK